MFGDRIELARNMRGLSQRDLAEAASLSAMAISKFERGELRVADDVAGTIARALKFPRSFFEKAVVPLPAPLYRKRSTMAAKILKKTHALAQVYVEAHMAVTTAARVRLPLKLRFDLGRVDVESAAEETRRALGLPLVEPIGNLTATLEQAGIVVVHLPESVDKFDAFSVWVEDVPVIVSGPGAPGVGDRLRLTNAHEVGHLVRHRGGGAAYDLAEEEANAFAGALLLPRAAILEDLRRAALTPAGLAPLKAKWRVSIQALFERAFRLGLATADNRTRFYKTLSRLGWRNPEPIDVPVEKPQVLRKAFAHLEAKGAGSQVLGRLLWSADFAPLLGFSVLPSANSPDTSPRTERQDDSI